MVSRIPHIILQAAVALFLAGFCASETRLSLDDPCVTYLPGMFSEFLIQNDGSVVLFPGSPSSGARVWRDGQWGGDTALAFEGIEGVVRDTVPVDQNHWIVLSQLSATDVALYEYSVGKLRMMGHIAGKFESPTLHWASDETAWVTSSEGVAYALKDGKVITHQFGPEVKKGRSPTIYYPPTLSLEIPDRGLWFWSHVQYEMPDFQGAAKPFIEGFHVYQNGEWRVVPHGAGKLGGAILEGRSDIIACGRYTGWVRMDARNGAVSEISYSLPPSEHGLFLHRTLRGNMLMIAACPTKVAWLATDRGGWLGQLLGIKNGQVQTLLSGVDLERVYHDKGRPVVDVPEGTLLAESRTGLLFVSADFQTVKRFDWKYGVPLPYIERMRISGRYLYALDRERGFAILDYRRLLRTRETPAAQNWTVFYASARSPVISPDGTLWRVSASNPRELFRCAGTEEVAVSLAGSGFPDNALGYITADTKNRLWLFDSNGRGHTAFLENGKWRTFDLLETAYSTVAAEEKNNPEYRVGSPRDFYYPVFAGDGRVAYQSISGICFFDGEKWIHSEGNIGGQRPEGPPFYREGVLTVRAGRSYYQLVLGVWKPANNVTDSPYGDNPRQPNWVDILPQDFPGYPSELNIRIRDSSGAVWAGGFENLWRGLHGLWAPFEVQHTPLLMARGIGDIQVDRAGFIWFTLLTGERVRLARYRPKSAPPRLEWTEPPQGESKTGSIKLGVRIMGTDRRYVVRRQVDNGEWQQSSSETALQDVSLEYLPNGVHTLRVQVFDELLRASNLLEHRVTVKRDYEKEIQEWMSLLKSPDYSKRDRASKALVSMGRPALPTLTALEKDAGADVQWWIRAIREEIERREPRP